MSELTTQPTSRVVRPVPEPVSHWTINDVLFRWNLAQNGAMLRCSPWCRPWSPAPSSSGSGS